MLYKLYFSKGTLVYGFLDPHNGYGPNLFVRKSKFENQIKLFGNGEELRDHIDIRLVSDKNQQLAFNIKYKF